MLLCTAAAWAAPRLTAEVRKSSIYEGESVTYTVTLYDAESHGPPDVSAIEKAFDIAEGGTSTQTQFVNGRVSRQVVFNYLLTPRGAGELTIPPATLTLKGKTLATNAVRLRVVPPQKQDLVLVTVDADRATVYPLQEFTVRLRVHVRRLPGEFADLDPVLQINPPLLRVPWVDVPEGLRSGDVSDWLSPKLSRRSRGFRINDLRRQGDAFSRFDERRAAVFDLGGAIATDKSDYFVYELTRTFQAARAGRYSFGKVGLQGRFADGQAGQRFVGRDIYTISDPLTVVVKAPPTKGRPAAYSGGVGRFAIRADVQPRKVRVGDPLTLTITVTGSGNLDEMLPPKLPGFDADFRVHPGTAATRDGARVFTYSLRATHKGVTAVPAVPFAYFDVQREKYVETATSAIPIEVEEAGRLDAGDIESGGAGATLRARGRELFANDADVRALRDERVEPWNYAAYLAALAVAYVIASLVIARVQRLRADPALLRRRGAAARARRRLGAYRARGNQRSRVVDSRVPGRPEPGRSPGSDCRQ